MKTTKLVVGILMIVLSVYIVFQSMLAGFGDALTNSGGTSEGSGLIFAILFLASGIVYIVNKSKTSLGSDIACMVMLLIAWLIGITMSGIYGDLIVWSWLAFIIGVGFFVWHLISNKKNPASDESSTSYKDSQNQKPNKPFYKKWWVWVLAVVVIIFLIGAFGSGNDNDSKKSSSSNSSSVENTDNQTTKTSQFSFSNNIFKANKLTYKITKSSIMNGVDNGKKVIVLEMDITNNTKKEINLSSDENAYEYIHAYQKTETSKKNLAPGTLGTDDNGNSPEQSREDTMNSDSLLPGKTVQGVVMFDLVNNSKVSITFDNADFDTIATKEYKVQ